MRFTQPDTFLCEAIWLGLYQPHGSVQPNAKGASADRCGFPLYVAVTKDTVTKDTVASQLPGGFLRWSVSSDLRLVVRRRFVMQINGLSQLHGTQSINSPHFNRTSSPNSAANPSSVDTTDELQLSPAAQMASKLSEIPDIRWDRVNDIKTAIANGSYMTDDKMNMAVDRLLDEIA
ncbi:MAG TPA: flagellar biosynthesis anti-sigma factor FlgM [Pirellulales bacterium]|jgi:negative regulator of flagellin synthesis FlgM|nr:flagellar biosynthesis anti-sigma factor FlgM [Pirellulales bacterium]